MWLHGKSANSVEAYTRDIERFLAFAGRSLRDLRLEDLQSYSDTLSDLKPSTKGRKLAAVKSLLTFAHEIGYVPFNVGRAVKLPKSKNTLAERILTESQVQQIIGRETSDRNRALLRLLYAAGLRVSEIVGLRWCDTCERDEAGQLTVHGKGEKSRYVLLSRETWRELVQLRGDAGDDAPIFVSREGGALTRRQVRNIVRRASDRAGVRKAVSPHWMRHAHASHALDRGAPVHLVKDTLGHASLATTSRYAHARPGDSSARYLAV